MVNYFFQVVYSKSDEQRQRLNEAVRHILLFRSLEPVSKIYKVTTIKQCSRIFQQQQLSMGKSIPKPLSHTPNLLSLI